MPSRNALNNHAGSDDEDKKQSVIRIIKLARLPTFCHSSCKMVTISTMLVDIEKPSGRTGKTKKK